MEGGRVMARFFSVLSEKLLLFAFFAIAAAAIMSALIGVIHLIAWFAFWGDVPPFPWVLLRFFVGIGWFMAALAALFAPLDDRP